MMAPLELLLLLLEAYYLVVYVAFVVGRIRLVWKWLLRLVLHWALEMVRCCSLLFLPSFRCHLSLSGFDPAKLCCRRHLGSSQGTMDNSPNSKSLLPNQRGRSTVGRYRRRCTTAKVGQTLRPMPCRYLDIPGCMTLMVLPELLLRPHLEHKDPRRGRLADPRFRFRKSQGPTPLAFDEALLVGISGQVCLGKNIVAAIVHFASCVVGRQPAAQQLRKWTSPRINEDDREVRLGSVSNVSNIGREHKFVIKKAQLCAPGRLDCPPFVRRT